MSDVVEDEDMDSCPRCGILYDYIPKLFLDYQGDLIDDKIYYDPTRGVTIGDICPACVELVETGYIERASSEELLLLINHTWHTQAGDDLYKSKLSGGS